jgi:plasmid maintenance system antidote protein VapI
MKSDTPISVLKKYIDDHGLRGAGRLLGISPSFLSAIIKGDKDISDSVARKLGFKRRTHWEKINTKD